MNSNKKNSPICYTLKSLLSIVLVLPLCFGTGCTFHPQNKEPESLRWIEEESYFVDYEITDSGLIKFRYSICYQNFFDRDVEIAITVDFKKRDLKGWAKELESHEGFVGCDENGERLYSIIKTGEKRNVVYTFEGEYLGGSVNTNLSFPDNLMMGLDFHYDDPEYFESLETTE